MIGSDHFESVPKSLFKKEALTRVDTHLATHEDVELSPNEFVFKDKIKKLTDVDIELLKSLSLIPVSGLPIDNKLDEDLYCSKYGLALDPDGSVHATSYPNAGRAVSIDGEGWVSGRNIYTNHSLKGVGYTKNAPDKSILGINSMPGLTSYHKAGVEIFGTNEASKIGVLTPLMLPPLIYETHIENGSFVDASIYKKRPFCVQRAWASDVRINELYESDGVHITSGEIDGIAKNPLRSRDLFKGRVSGFLEDAKTVHDFNLLKGTDYSLGCSKLMDGDFSQFGYVKAFKLQMQTNLAMMINGGLWHQNLSGQNVSIAGEIGDWDSYSFVNEKGSVVLEDGHIIEGSDDVEIAKARLTLISILDVCRLQGIIQISLGDGNHDSIGKIWSDVSKKLPESHGWKKFSIEDLYGLAGKESESLSDVFSLVKVSTIRRMEVDVDNKMTALLEALDNVKLG